MTYAVGDQVTITWADGRVVPAAVILASGNGRSVVLEFEAILDGYVGQMPVLLDELGNGFRAVMTGQRGWID